MASKCGLKCHKRRPQRENFNISCVYVSAQPARAVLHHCGADDGYLMFGKRAWSFRFLVQSDYLLV
jgi:hypothetical protein